MKRNINSRNPVYIFVAAIITFSMLLGMFGMSGCRENTEAYSYEQAERALISSALSSYSSYPSLTEALQKYNKSGRVNLTFTPREYLARLLGEEKLNPTEFEINKGETFSNIIYKNGEKEVLSGNIWLNENEAIIGIPQLLSKYILADLNAVPNGGGLDIGAIATMVSNAVTSFAANPQELAPLSEESVQTFVNTVIDEYFAVTADSESFGITDLVINGTNVEATTTVIEFTDEMAYKVALAALRAVQGNAELKELIGEIAKAAMPGGMAGSLVELLITGYIGTLEENLAAITEPEIIAQMTVYISGSEIVAREIHTIGELQGVSINTHSLGDYFFKQLTYFDSSLSVSADKKTGKFELNSSINYGAENYRIKFEGKCGKERIEGEIFADGIEIGTIVLTFGDSVIESKPAPALNPDNNIDLGEISQLFELLEALAALNENLDDDGVYDVVGALLMHSPFAPGMNGLRGRW
ncbi:MAG: hypothetical protein FWH07_07900 [Oscillospiraceae bacterium]|nr:hypothetical protein [Oscillospiraceae bacterium]